MTEKKIQKQYSYISTDTIPFGLKKESMKLKHQQFKAHKEKYKELSEKKGNLFQTTSD
jgi:hypothetical protein